MGRGKESNPRKDGELLTNALHFTKSFKRRVPPIAQLACTDAFCCRISVVTDILGKQTKRTTKLALRQNDDYKSGQYFSTTSPPQGQGPDWCQTDMTRKHRIHHVTKMDIWRRKPTEVFTLLIDRQQAPCLSQHVAALQNWMQGWHYGKGQTNYNTRNIGH